MEARVVVLAGSVGSTGMASLSAAVAREMRVLAATIAAEIEEKKDVLDKALQELRNSLEELDDYYEEAQPSYADWRLLDAKREKFVCTTEQYIGSTIYRNCHRRCAPRAKVHTGKNFRRMSK